MVKMLLIIDSFHSCPILITNHEDLLSYLRSSFLPFTWISYFLLHPKYMSFITFFLIFCTDLQCTYWMKNSEANQHSWFIAGHRKHSSFTTTALRGKGIRLKRYITSSRSLSWDVFASEVKVGVKKNTNKSSLLWGTFFDSRICFFLSRKKRNNKTWGTV